MRPANYERRQRIADLALAGHRPSEIAHMVGLKQATVRKILCEYREAGTPIPEFPKGIPASSRLPSTTYKLNLTLDEYERLIKEARARKTGPVNLIRDIVKTVIEENLFNAVLEDK